MCNPELEVEPGEGSGFAYIFGFQFYVYVDVVVGPVYVNGPTSGGDDDKDIINAS